MEQPIQVPVLRLSEDRGPLERKLQEYRDRIAQNPFRAPETQLDTFYKIAVLEPLVRNGFVRRSDVYALLHARYGDVEDVMLYNAYGVIADYIETGGSKVAGGTGLSRISVEDVTVRE